MCPQFRNFSETRPDNRAAHSPSLFEDPDCWSGLALHRTLEMRLTVIL